MNQQNPDWTDLPFNYVRQGPRCARRMDARVHIRYKRGVWRWQTYRPIHRPEQGVAPTLAYAISAAEYALRVRWDTVMVTGEAFDDLAAEADRRGIDVSQLVEMVARHFAEEAMRDF